MGFINAHLMGTWTPAGEPASAQQITGQVAVESYTDSDATNDVITFTQPIYAVEVWHAEATAQEFTINGEAINIGPHGWRSLVGGTPSTEVTIPNGVTCAVTRCV